MNELNELELNKEVESIKAQIAIEYEKRNNIKPLYERFDRFIWNKKMVSLIGFLIFLCLYSLVMFIIGNYTPTSYLIGVGILAFIIILDFCISIRKIPINILDEKLLDYIRNTPFLVDIFRKSLNQDSTIKYQFVYHINRYSANIECEIFKLNGLLEKQQKRFKTKHLYNIAKDI